MLLRGTSKWVFVDIGGSGAHRYSIRGQPV